LIDWYSFDLRSRVVLPQVVCKESTVSINIQYTLVKWDAQGTEYYLANVPLKQSISAEKEVHGICLT